MDLGHLLRSQPSMNPTGYIRVESTWGVTTPSGPEYLLGPEARVPLQRCLRVHQGPFEFDPETMVEVDTCVQLCTPEEEPKGCELSFEDSSYLSSISRLVLVSECRRVEFYGSQGEYISTKEGKLLEDSDPEMILFHIETDLAQLNMSKFHIRLTGLETSCWILALHLGVERSSKPAMARFNLQTMNHLLGNDGDSNLSQKAKDFKQLFETFQKSPTGPQFASPLPMMVHPGMLELLPRPPVPDFDAQIVPNQQSHTLTEGIVGSHQANGDSSKCCCDCKNELKEMEERILIKMEEYQKSQNEKMNKILVMLEALSNKN